MQARVAPWLLSGGLVMNGSVAKSKKGVGGYSLAEMLVVVAIIGVIVLVMLPAFGNFSRTWKSRSNADDMLTALKGAHQMAITMHQNITVTFTPDPANTYSYFHPIQK